MALTCAWASQGREGSVLGGPEKQDSPPPPFCLLPVPGSIDSAMLTTDWLTGTKGGREGKQVSLWPLNPVTPKLCFSDKVLPAPGCSSCLSQAHTRSRAVPPNTQKKRKAVADNTLAKTWLRRLLTAGPTGQQGTQQHAADSPHGGFSE